MRAELAKIFLAAFVLMAASANAQTVVLTSEGFAPLKIGMTLRQAEAAIGRKIELLDEAGEDPHVCAVVDIPGHRGVSALFEYERIAVIYIEKPYRTVDGVYYGMPEANLKKRFGKRAIFDYRPYLGGDPHAHNVVVKEGGKREFLFQTEDDKVTTISVGNLPGVEYWEGCA